eukprot:718311-Rhodomonas_salina.1
MSGTGVADGASSHARGMQCSVITKALCGTEFLYGVMGACVWSSQGLSAIVVDSNNHRLRLVGLEDALYGLVSTIAGRGSTGKLLLHRPMRFMVTCYGLCATRPLCDVWYCATSIVLRLLCYAVPGTETCVYCYQAVFRMA